MHLSKSYMRRTVDLYGELQPPPQTVMLRLPGHIVPQPVTVEDVAGWLRTGSVGGGGAMMILASGNGQGRTARRENIKARPENRSTPAKSPNSAGWIARRSTKTFCTRIKSD
jgi:hypothetical protein